jgi:hypothetical protein
MDKREADRINAMIDSMPFDQMSDVQRIAAMRAIAAVAGSK